MRLTETLNPKLQTRNPKPQTPNPRPQTLNHETLNQVCDLHTLDPPLELEHQNRLRIVRSAALKGLRFRV